MSEQKNHPLDISERLATYDKATKFLMRRVSKMRMPIDAAHEFDMPQMVKRFRDAFELPGVRMALLSPQHEESRLATANFSAGFCGIASYAWHHMFRTTSGAPIWQMYQYHDIGCGVGYLNRHVWLQNALDGQVFDLTFDQSVDSRGQFIKIPYELGTPVDGNFLFGRAFKFAKYIDVDLRDIVARNTLRDYD